MVDQPFTDKNPRGAGRKIHPEGRMVQMMIRLLPSQKLKLKELGGAAWLREQIERARQI